MHDDLAGSQVLKNAFDQVKRQTKFLTQLTATAASGQQQTLADQLFDQRGRQSGLFQRGWFGGTK